MIVNFGYRPYTYRRFHETSTAGIIKQTKNCISFFSSTTAGCELKFKSTGIIYLTTTVNSLNFAVCNTGIKTISRYSITLLNRITMVQVVSEIPSEEQCLQPYPIPFYLIIPEHLKGRCRLSPYPLS